MAKDEYFSFGDEELHGAPDDFSLREESGALAVADPPKESLAAEEGSLAAEKRAARPRGDSAKGSSEKRRPSARRTHIAVAVALSLVGFLCARVVVSALGGEARSSSGSQQTAKDEVRGGTEAPGGPRPAVRLSRERATERQQIRGRRTNTRRRARRHREKRKAERRHRSELLREEKSAQAPAPEYAPQPAPEAAAPSIPEPETSEANATPDGGGLHDGSSSAEFGL